MDTMPAPPWRTPRKTGRQPLSQDMIVATGLRILDEEGLEALSMRRIAQELGTGPASLYAHVANKEELLELIFDQVSGEIDIPEPDPARWAEQLREACRSIYRVLTEHGDVARVPLSNIPTGPNSLKVSEGLLAIMLAGGVPPQIAAWGLDRVYLYVTADVYEGSLYTVKQRASGLPPEEFVADYFGQIRQYFSRLPPDRFPAITGNIDVLMGGDGDQRFEFGLDLLIRGLESYASEATNRDMPDSQRS
ncbi:TetR/AcrR family transcriptional regulator C-terminal domain-containing protein [Streptosporangiaceae bacterium NEAU-GS5]|nr:TetR/AcrR family transcriptional regulator C-terminal domain-containing protein [Streptosporangiaceae bacterium NEAU-GS5]